MSISKTTFDGLDAVELKTDGLHLVAVSQFGPRICHLSLPDGENLLLWQPGKYTRKGWDLRGGHRVWATRPGADEAEATYATDNEPCHVEIAGDNFTLTGAEDPASCTRRGFTVKIIEDDKLEVTSFVTNTGEMLYSGGVWALTCTVPGEGTRYGIPLGDGSEWDCFTQVMFKRWGGHDGAFGDEQIVIDGDMMIVDPKGSENKRMLQSHSGVIAMSDPSRGLTFAKRTGHVRGGAYPSGCNMAFYIGPDNFMVEMETMSPEVTLRSGETATNVETWVLRPGADPLDDPAGLAAV